MENEKELEPNAMELLEMSDVLATKFDWSNGSQIYFYSPNDELNGVLLTKKQVVQYAEQLMELSRCLADS